VAAEEAEAAGDEDLAGGHRLRFLR
jgi:hypothetical protein